MERNRAVAEVKGGLEGVVDGIEEVAEVDGGVDVGEGEAPLVEPAVGEGRKSR